MGKYLDFYKNCARKKRMPQGGLCQNDLDGVSLFRPNSQEKHEYALEFGFNHGDSVSYWAAGLPALADISRRQYAFTPMRQNIVLFLAAMNNEDFNELKR